MNNTKRNSIYIYDYNEEKLVAKISERNGLLVAQLYRFLDPETRPHYTTFLKQLYKIKGLRYTRVLTKCNSLFVSVQHSVSEINMKKMLLAAEGELKNERPASWFKKADELYKIYDVLAEGIPNNTEGLIGKVEKDNFHSRLESASIVVKYTSGRLKRITDKKRASNKLKKEKLRMEAEAKERENDLTFDMLTNEIRDEEVVYLNRAFGVDELGEAEDEVRNLKECVKEVDDESIDTGRTKEEIEETINDKRRFDDLGEYGIPPVTLLNLHAVGIYFTIGGIEKGVPSSYIFHYFDAANNITAEKWRVNISMIYDFMVWHGFGDNFSIKVHTGSDVRRDVYQDSLRLNKSTLKYVELITPLKLVDALKWCKGIEFDSLSADKMFNTPAAGASNSWADKEKLFTPKIHAKSVMSSERSKVAEKVPDTIDQEGANEWDIKGDSI